MILTTRYRPHYYCRCPRFSLFWLFSSFYYFFSGLTEGYNDFLPFYKENLAPRIEEDILELRVQDFSVCDIESKYVNLDYVFFMMCFDFLFNAGKV